MVNIDDVYQKVLVLANKEQRGYITHQEFNIVADKSQLEIITQYLHDIKTGNLRPMNNSESSDFLEMTKEKIDYLRRSHNYTSYQNTSDSDFDKSVIYPTQNTNAQFADILEIANIHTRSDMKLVERVDGHDLRNILNNQYTYPTLSRPIYHTRDSWFTNNTNLHNRHVEIYPMFEAEYQFQIDYWRKPKTPNWGYVVVNQKPLYNFNTSQHFELHPICLLYTSDADDE